MTTAVKSQAVFAYDELVRPDSSAVRLLAYNESAKQLVVSWYDAPKAYYIFKYVPRHVYETIRDASSVGRSVSLNIVGQYSAEWPIDDMSFVPSVGTDSGLELNPRPYDVTVRVWDINSYKAVYQVTDALKAMCRHFSARAVKEVE